MPKSVTSKIRDELNGKLAKLVGLPLQEFINQVGQMPEVAPDLEGVWCGREGKTDDLFAHGPFAGTNRLVVGWAHGKVEYAYIS